MSDHHFKATGQQAFQVVQLERQYNDLICQCSDVNN
jgi:hypothetical protein